MILALSRLSRWVETFDTVCLVIRYYLVYCLFICLHYLFPVAIVRCRRFWESPIAQHSRLWAAASGRARQVPFTMLILYAFFSSIYNGMHALKLLPKPHTLGIWVHTWLVMLSCAVMRVMQVFHSLWRWVWLVSLWEMVFHPSRCELTMVRIDAVVWAMVEMVNTVMPCHAWICQGLNLRSRHHRTTCATTCPVWNDLLTN
jgi:hypothetical protein